MKLKELVGTHSLDAVDFSTKSIETWGDSFEDCQVCRFRLDGITYMAIEDPNDGYRSTMEELGIDKGAKMKNVFSAIDVVSRHRTKGSYGNEDDILEILDVNSGKRILEVGTESIDDYYPSYVANFHPENIGVTPIKDVLREGLIMKAIKFNCHGNSAPAYSCNQSGDNSGEYVLLKTVEELEKDIITLVLRLKSENFDTFAPETAEVMARWLPKADEILRETYSVED